MISSQMYSTCTVPTKWCPPLHKLLSDMHWSPHFFLKFSRGAVCENTNVWVEEQFLKMFLASGILHLLHTWRRCRWRCQPGKTTRWKLVVMLGETGVKKNMQWLQINVYVMSSLLPVSPRLHPSPKCSGHCPVLVNSSDLGSLLQSSSYVSENSYSLSFP